MGCYLSCASNVSCVGVRRLIKGGGVYVNNVKVAEEAAAITEGDLIEGQLLLLAAGKKNKMLVRVKAAGA